MVGKHEPSESTSELTLEELESLEVLAEPVAGGPTLPPETGGGELSADGADQGPDTEEEVFEVGDGDVFSVPAPRPRASAVPAAAAPLVPPPAAASSPRTRSSAPPPPGPSTRRSTSAVPPPDLLSDAKRLVAQSLAELGSRPPAARAARLHFDIAHHLEALLGDADGALEHFRATVGIQPDHVGAWRGIRRVLMRRGQHDEALLALDHEARATRDPSARAALFFLRGRILSEGIGDVTRARAAFQAAHELDRTNVTYLDALGRLALLEQNWAELDRVLEMRGNAVGHDSALRAAIMLERAILREARLGDPDGAVDLLESALAAAPASQFAIASLERLLASRRRARDLVRVLEHAAEREASTAHHASLRVWAARVYADQLGERDRAIDALTRARELAPSEAWIADLLAGQLEDAGRFEEAARVLADRAQLTEDAALGQHLEEKVGALYAEKVGDLATAIDWLTQARRREPRTALGGESLKLWLTQTGRHQELLELLRAELELLDDPRRKAATCVRMGDLTERELGRPDEAIEHHIRALGAAPDYAPALASLDRLLADAQRWRELSALHRRAVDASANPKARVAHLLRIAQIYDDELFEPENALEAYREVLAADAENLSAIRGLGRAGERAGAHADVVSALERESSLTPLPEERAHLLLRAADVALRRMGDRELAERLYRRAIVSSPQNRAAREGLAEVLLAAGHWDALLEVHREMLPLVSDRAARSRLLLRMADIAESRVGDHAQAASLYREAVREDPRHLAAERALLRRLRQDGNWEAAGEVLRAQLARADLPEGERAAASLELARILEEKLGRPRDALDVLEARDGAAVSDRDLDVDLERLLADTGDGARLIAHLTAAVERAEAPRRAAWLLELGKVLDAGEGDLLRAGEALERAVEFDSEDLLALRALATVRERSGNWNGLAVTLAKLARTVMEPQERTSILWALARVEAQHLGAGPDARSTYEAILSLSHGDVAALDALERIAIESSDRRLLAEIDLARAGHPDSPATRAAYLTRLGESYELLGDARATETYRAALELDPENHAAVRALSRIAESAGDAALLADALAREAGHTHDRKHAADLLLRSASLRAEHLGDGEGAARDLERAVELDPTRADVAQALSARLLAAGDAQRAAEVLARAAGASPEGADRDALWIEVARMEADLLGSPQQAIGTLGRVLRTSPDHLLANRRLAELLVRDGQWMDAIQQLERLRTLTRDPVILRDAALERSRIWLEKLRDPERALEAVEGVLALDPYHRVAIGRQVDAYEALARWDLASEATDRLLELAPQGVARREVLLRIASLEERQGHRERARDIRLDCAREDGPGGEAALLLKAALTTQQEWAAYARAMEQHAEQCLTRGESPVPSLLELSRVLHAHLGDAARAAAVLEQGIRAAGDAGPLRLELAERLNDAGRLDDATRELDALAHEAPTEARPLHLLAETHRKRSDALRLDATLSVLAVLGELTPAERALYDTRSATPWLGRGGKLTRAQIRGWLPQGGAELAAGRILEELSPILGKLYPPDHGAFGLTARDRESTKHPSALRSLVDRVLSESGSGGAVDLYVHGVRSRGLAVEFGAPPALFVPAALHEMTVREQTFLLAKPLLAAALGMEALEKLTPREVQVLIAATVRLTSPKFGEGLTSEEDLEELRRRIQKALPRKSKRPLEEASAALLAAPPLDYAAWARGVHQGLRELAAVIANDLPEAVELTRRLDRELGLRPGDDVVRRSPAIQDMLRAWLSPRADAVRLALASPGGGGAP